MVAKTSSQGLHSGPGDLLVGVQSLLISATCPTIIIATLSQNNKIHLLYYGLAQGLVFLYFQRQSNLPFSRAGENISHAEGSGVA